MATTAADDAAEITSRILLETKSIPFNPIFVDCQRVILFARAPTVDGSGRRPDRARGRP